MNAVLQRVCIMAMSPCLGCGHLPSTLSAASLRFQSPVSTSEKLTRRHYVSEAHLYLERRSGRARRAQRLLVLEETTLHGRGKIVKRGDRSLRFSGAGDKGPGESETPESKTSSSVTTTDKPHDEEPKPSTTASSSGTDSVPQQSKEETDKFVLDAFSVMELLGPEKVDVDDIRILKEKVFGYTTFWVTGQESFGEMNEGVLLLGNLRGKREDIFNKVQKGLRDSLGDKYDLFMIEEPNATEPDPRGGPRVSFLLLRKEISQARPTPVWQYIIAGILIVLTGGACLELGLATQISRLPPDVVNYFTSSNPEELEPPDLSILIPYVRDALPLAYGVMGIQIFHEVGHRLVANAKGVKLGIPFLIPNITLGSFGSITEFKSIVPSRTAKFDLSVAGPAAGGGLSLAMFALGLALSIAPEAQPDLVQVPTLLFQGSLLLGSICGAVLGPEAMSASSVSIHPLVVAGWCGITTTAFNMLPVGCLDGGRAMQAAFGKSAQQGSSLVSYLLLGLGLLGGPLSLPWGLYILILQRPAEKPALNDVSGVGVFRQGVLVIALIFVVFTLLPSFQQLTQDLGGDSGAYF